MYRLLIVDDEAIIVDGLYERFVDLMIPELDLYKAYSGSEALTWLNSKKIDIVITDIKMPGIDGMQLLERIRENWPDCKVVFLTGHEKFEYVYKAIRYDGVKYILKTEGYDSIIEVVQGYLEEIRSSRKDDELLQQAKLQLQRSLPVLQKEFLLERMEASAAPVVQDQLDELGIALQAQEPVLLLACSILDSGNRGAISSKTDDYKVGLIVEGQLSRHVALAGSSYRGHMFWLMQVKRDIGQEWAGSVEKTVAYLKGVLESAQEVCWATFELTVSFAISSAQVSWDTIATEFDYLRTMLIDAGKSGMEVVLCGDAEAQDRQEPGGAGQWVAHELKKAERLEFFLEQGRREEFMAVVDEIKAVLAKRPGKDPRYLETAYKVTVMLLSYLNRRDLAGRLPSGIEKLMQIGSIESPQQAFGCFVDVAQSIFDLQASDQDSRAASAVQKVRKYIQDNPGGDLSLSSLADMVYFNPKYLSRLFKQVAGVYLSDYINEVRLGKVKELLRQNRMKVHEVAEYAGYFSAPCFTRFFKKAMGMTPQEYRDSFLQ